MSPTKKIFLLVDDDEDDRDIFREVLRQLDPEIIVHEAVNGKEALDLLSKETNNLPDLIFLDVNMPVMSGWECLKKLKQNESLQHIPVVIFSTSSSQRDVDLAFDLQASFYWIKPADFNQMKDILKLLATETAQDIIAAIKQIPGEAKGFFFPPH